MTQSKLQIPKTANFIQAGEGAPVVLIHGVAASLHDWDDLIPRLTQNGYACYALDLLGHGGSPKPESRAYQMDWLFEHFTGWITSLRLTEPAVIIGHSLGGYLALEYARRFPIWTKALILVDPLYSRSQLPPLLRRSFSRHNLRGRIAEMTPKWMFRAFVDVASRAMGHGTGASHSLPEHVRAQTALDYARTAPGVYNLTNTIDEMTEYLPSMTLPALVVWGDRDPTLSPASFPRLVKEMPRASGKAMHAGHVPHQSNAGEFNEMVVGFLKNLAL